MNRTTPWEEIRERMQDEAGRIQERLEDGLDKLERATEED